MQLATKPVRLGLLVIAVLAILAIIYSLGASEAEEVAEASLPVVTVTTATQYAGNSTINLIGTVRAFSEAAVTTETAGRVTGVRVGLGDSVAAGQIIATIENASQQAAVLQAEGSYDAALASLEQSQFGNAQSQVGIAEARTNLNRVENSINATVNSTLNTINNILVSEVDVYYNQPNSPAPRLEIASGGNSRTLEVQRVALGDQVEGLQVYLRAGNSNYEVTEALQITKEAVGSTLDLVELFIAIFKDDEDVVRTDNFSSLRSSLINTQLALNNERTALESALDTVTRAQLGASESNSSAANAQVKQALGSLRAAQANLSKTIIRTPISGTVNSIDIRTGDFVNSFAQVALVANNNALEIITFIGENDREVFAIGDTVTLDGQFTGTVMQIAPAVNAGTGKTEVRIASESEDLQNGDSVRVNKEVAGDTISEVIIPLSAVKFALNDGSVFVIEDNKLVERAVTLGTVRGGSVEILDGLSITDEFVADARGLVASTEVEVMQ
jgi:RND family efflux transporter MFP subunit